MSGLFEAYPRYEYALAATQLALAMLGMGALLGPRDFAQVVRAPRALAVGVALQIGLVPLLASATGQLLPVPAGIAAGLVLVAAVPGGTLSNVLTYFAGGNIALSITLTAVTTVGALVTTPALLRLYVGAYLPPDFAMPAGRIASEIGLTLLLPLLAGMVAGTRLGERREVFSRTALRASLAVIGVMVVGAAGAGRMDPLAYGRIGPASVLLLACVFQLAAVLAGRLGRLAPRDRLAIVIEATLRNTNLAVLVKASILPATVVEYAEVGDAMFFVALLYGGFGLGLSTLLVMLGRREIRV